MESKVYEALEESEESSVLAGIIDKTSELTYICKRWRRLANYEVKRLDSKESKTKREETRTEEQNKSSLGFEIQL
ncbi:hypothetical protein J6590_059437 [Homalodisca vitripennis]|nr:hypothetical protein J6590_059437 [Homalodisca vitripennis]